MGLRVGGECTCTAADAHIDCTGSFAVARALSHRAALTEPKDLGWLLDAPTSDWLAKLHFDIAAPISSKV